MKLFPVIIALILSATACQFNPAKKPVTFRTISNPVNLSYRFTLDEPSRREAADPSVVWFKDRYYLFPSKSGGYFHSEDLVEWTLIETNQIPVEEYAPTAIVVGDNMYFLGSSTERSVIYMTDDPLKGEWSAARELEIPVWDPAFFLDDGNRLFLYWGCSDVDPIWGVEVDYDNGFAFMSEPVVLIEQNPARYGWEVPGDYNTLINQAPWIEGAWMTKRDGMYYLQYSGPGTEFKSYADAVYTSENPLGPFTLQLHNPFVYKPEGFAAGAGHGSLFPDQYGNMWHIGTITISQRHVFERRLGLYPAFYDEDGTLYSITRYGDYPLIMPDRKVDSWDDIFPGWMLLSYGKNVETSSSVDTLPARNMTDEDIRTYWSAESGGDNEFAFLDMGEHYDVFAVQINFAEHNTNIFGREKGLRHRYILEYSNDGINWSLLADKSGNNRDNTHDYIQLEDKVACRYLKISNIEVPGGHFAISGFRAFGRGGGPKPSVINRFEVTRKEDRRSVSLSWEPVENATGYNISFGADRDKLYNDYIVYADNTLTINILDVNKPYHFTIQAFNENGITKSGKIVTVP
jgi:xylan 1,4-beta-xylosidase